MTDALLLAAVLAQGFHGVATAHDESTVSAFDPQVQDLSKRDEPPMLGVHWSREVAGSHASRELATSPQVRASRSPLMTNHGGKIMPSDGHKAIFWGTSWSGTPGDKITGMDSSTRAGTTRTTRRPTPSTPAATARSAPVPPIRATGSTLRRPRAARAPRRSSPRCASR